jgi:hypothetical protein
LCCLQSYPLEGEKASNFGVCQNIVAAAIATQGKTVVLINIGHVNPPSPPPWY